jgi:hypothetical protein
LAYGTDWLAFAHLVIAIAFLGPLKDPVRNIWVVEFGMIACLLVIPLALICGPIRGIPFYGSSAEFVGESRAGASPMAAIFGSFARPASPYLSRPPKHGTEKTTMWELEETERRIVSAVRARTVFLQLGIGTWGSVKEPTRSWE